MSGDFVQSPVGEILFHEHGLVVAILDGCDGQDLVSTKAHYDRSVAGGRDRSSISRAFNDTASDVITDALFSYVLLVLLQTLITISG